jgi:hypothetical protein
MSRIIVALATAWTLLLGHRADAQDLASEVKKLDSLKRAWAAAAERVSWHEDSLRAVRFGYDSLVVPPLSLLLESGLGAIVDSAARQAAGRLLLPPAIGSRELRGLHFTVRWFEGDSSRVLVSVIDTMGREWGQRPVLRESGSLGDALRESANHLLAQRLDQDMRSWLDVQVGPDTLPTSAWRGLRLDLVSSNANIGPKCFDGDLTACHQALGLRPTADPVTEWYSESGRRRLVRAHEWSVRRGNGVATRSCLDGNDEACVVALHAAPSVPLQVAPALRRSLAQLALQMGGPGAFERLYLSRGTPAERLMQTAGAPVDSIVRLWHARVRDTRAPSDAMTKEIAAMSLVWILMCGALSLRSSRWR